MLFDPKKLLLIAGPCSLENERVCRAVAEKLIEIGRANPELRIVSTRALVSLAEMVSAGTLNHDDILRVLMSASNLDFVVDLNARRLIGNPAHGGEQMIEMY